jgi:serine/threonine protein kinase
VTRKIVSTSAKAPVNAKLADFGTSRYMDSEKKDYTKAIGTPVYMAPVRTPAFSHAQPLQEVLQSDDYNEAADVFSYSILLYEMFSENPPYPELKRTWGTSSGTAITHSS